MHELSSTTISVLTLQSLSAVFILRLTVCQWHRFSYSVGDKMRLYQ